MKTIPLFLLFGIFCGVIVLLTAPDLLSQRGMNVTVRTEDGDKFGLYKDSYALVIGNGDYPVTNGWNPLPGAIKDVKEVAEVLETHGFNVTLKIDVTKSEFNQAFSEFIYESGKNPDNRLLFYYAGHGYTTKAATGEDLGYLVMLDTPNPENAAAFDLYSVDMVKFVSDSKKIHAKHVLFMFDSCFSGTVLNLRNRVTPSHITDRIKNPVRQFITAGRADEPVPDRSEFKKAFLNILEGRVEEPTPDGYLTGVELGDYLYRTVPKFSQGQHPQHGKIHDQQLNTGDFVFVLSQNNSEDSGVELDTIAMLNITSNPSGAMVYIDGVLIGITPLDNYEIDTGPRLEKQVNIGLELSGYKSRVKKIKLKGGQQVPWDVSLEKMTSKSAESITDVESNEATATYLSLVSDNPNILVPINDMKEWSGWHGWFWEKVKGEQPTERPSIFSGNYADRFDHWMYSHAESYVVYDISGGEYSQFDGHLITPSSCIETIELIFLVDNKVVYNSGRVRVFEPMHVAFNIPADAKTLTIRVTDGGDGGSCDHWILGDPRLLETRQPISTKPKPDALQTTTENDITINQEAPSPSLNMPQMIVGKDGTEMVLIPAGDFQMGSGAGRLYNSATIPAHTVYVDTFYIDKYEVTVGQYNQFVRATGHPPLPDWVSKYSPTDQHPVVGITWDDAIAYAKWASKRLPTEAEWEKAARGGLIGTEHPWGNAPLDGTQCNFADKNLSKIWDRERKPEDNWADKNINDGYALTAPVGSYPPNGYGLYDMVGNVWEYCFDAYDKNFYANSPRRNPVAQIIVKDGENNIVAVNKLRVGRGISWYDAPHAVWIANRLGVDPKGKTFNVGFRCVRSVTP